MKVMLMNKGHYTKIMGDDWRIMAVLAERLKAYELMQMVRDFGGEVTTLTVRNNEVGTYGALLNSVRNTRLCESVIQAKE